MERNIQRIDGIKTHVHALSDAELAGHIGHAEARRASADNDISILTAEAHRRANVELPLGEVALEGYAEIADTLIPPYDSEGRYLAAE